MRPAERTRGKQALSLAEREEVSRGLSVQQSLRSIARQLGRAPSTLSREIGRNGGVANYRATVSDQAAWWTCNGFVPVSYLITPPWPQMRAG